MRSALLVLAALLVSCGGDDPGTQPVPDTQPPDVEILAPSPGGVSGSVEVRLAAFDNRDVTGVWLLIDGVQLLDEKTAAPYTWVWNASSATNGAHRLVGKARDAAGYVGTSDTVLVTVSGGVAP